MKNTRNACRGFAAILIIHLFLLASSTTGCIISNNSEKINDIMQRYLDAIKNVNSVEYIETASIISNDEKITYTQETLVVINGKDFLLIALYGIRDYKEIIYVDGKCYYKEAIEDGNWQLGIPVTLDQQVIDYLSGEFYGPPAGFEVIQGFKTVEYKGIEILNERESHCLTFELSSDDLRQLYSINFSEFEPNSGGSIELFIDTETFYPIQMTISINDISDTYSFKLEKVYVDINVPFSIEPPVT